MSKKSAIATDSLLPPLWLLTTLVLLLMGWLVHELREIFVLLVVGYCIAYLIEPVLAWLERRRVKRSLGILFVFAGAVFLLFVLIATAVPTLVEQYRVLAQRLPGYAAELETRWLPALQSVADRLPDQLRQDAQQGIGNALSPQAISGVLKRVWGGVVSTLLHGYSLTLTIANLLLLPFIVYYLALEFGALHRGMLQLFIPEYRKRVARIGADIDRYVSAFVRGQFIVCTILTVFYMLGLGIIGVELWFLLAVVSGFGNLIPYVGFLVGIVLSSLMALFTFGDFPHILAVWGLYGVAQFLEGTFITPRIIGEKVGLSPLVIILALFAGGQLFGLLGIFLAIPMAAAMKVLLAETHGWVMNRG